MAKFVCGSRTGFKAAAAAITLIFLAFGAKELIAGPFGSLQLAYHATFGNGSLKSGLDTLGVGDLILSDSAVPDTNPAWIPGNGEMLLAVTRPNVPVTGPVAAGVFALPVDFGPGSVVGMKASFIEPKGPHGAGERWAATVGGRTGGVNDLFSESRTVASLQVNGATARLNVVGASPPVNLPNMPQEMYDAIFDPVNPKPFTMEILLDRQTGVGRATLQVEAMKISTTFNSGPFPADSGPSITAIGPTIANANANGQRVSVRLRDFQVFTRGAAAENRPSDCPKEFGCRRWTTSD